MDPGEGAEVGSEDRRGGVGCWGGVDGSRLIMIIGIQTWTSRDIATLMSKSRDVIIEILKYRVLLIITILFLDAVSIPTPFSCSINTHLQQCSKSCSI